MVWITEGVARLLETRFGRFEPGGMKPSQPSEGSLAVLPVMTSNALLSVNDRTMREQKKCRGKTLPEK